MSTLFISSDGQLHIDVYHIIEGISAFECPEEGQYWLYFITI